MFNKKTRTNRAFYDALIRLIWCEIRLPIGHPARSQGDEWADDILPWWNKWREDLTATPREKMSPSLIKFLTDWMASHTANYDARKGREQMQELFTDCQLEALNACPSFMFAKPIIPP